MTDQLIGLAGQFGAPGFLIAFMIWDRREQNALTKSRTAADIEMAKAMTTFAERLPHVR